MEASPEGSDESRMADIMTREVLRLDKVVGDLLDFARPDVLNLTDVGLNELVERTARLSRFSARLHLILQDPGALEDALLLRVRELLPGARIWYDRVREQAERISRRMYVEPDNLPLILVTDEPLIGIYAVSGYNVGSGDLLLRIMEEGQQAFGYEKR